MILPVKEGPAKLPRKNDSTCDGQTELSRKHFSPASTASERIPIRKRPKGGFADADNCDISHAFTITGEGHMFLVR